MNTNSFLKEITYMIHKIEIPTPFAVGDVNAFLVKGDTLSLIDAGIKTPEAYEALKFSIKEAGYTFNEIEQVILTHHHPDHSGWVEAFDRAELLGHVYNDFLLSRDKTYELFHDEFYYNNFIEAGVSEKYMGAVKKMKNSINYIGERPLDSFLKEGDQLPGHPNWKVLETLGHAQSHLVFWNEQTGEMIGGDLLLPKTASNPLIEPPLDLKSDRPRSLLQYHASLNRLLTLPVDIIYTGHGDEIRNAHTLIESRFKKQHERAMRVLKLIGNERKTSFELTQQLFPTVYERQLGLTLSETTGQIDYLVNEGLISGVKEGNGSIYYGKS